MNQVDQIKELQRQGLGPQEIAGRLKLDRKTVTRYMKRDNYERGLKAKAPAVLRLDPFKAKIDEWLEEDHRMRFKQRHTAKRVHERLAEEFPDRYDRRIVLDLIKDDYSPEQISFIVKTYFGFSRSHETIYLYLLYDKKKGGTLYQHLRVVPKRRRKRYNSHDSMGRLQGKRMIDYRPLEIEYRTSIGHWEGDTVIGSDRHHCIVTLVERKTGFLIIKRIKARTVEEVNKACIEAILEHEKNFKSITFDNGTEFHGYKKLEELYPVTCYFANPYHSWERGTNENTNGLIRQYIPKKSCMKSVSQADCDRIAYKLNT
ncbi:MAG: IS30 family transposase, partial [Spirochaetales bacterium]|nr:IS30 family transposase [Spirochaetales bacterium]